MKGEYISTDTNVDFDSIIKKVESALDESPRYKAPKYKMKFVAARTVSEATEMTNRYLTKGWEYVDTKIADAYGNTIMIILRKETE